MDRSRSLTQLENDDWGAPTYDSYLVRECHRLRNVPLSELTVENLRMLIGQGISLKYTVPLALERLVENPLVAGDMFKADLLSAVQGIPEAFWAQHPDMAGKWTEVKRHAS